MLEGDKYHLWVPIVDTELNKAIEMDANGDYIVQGVMTSDDRDEESDVIDPIGMDCSYFLEKGWIKYEHGNNPEQFIGEPLEVRLGRFTHPKTQKSVHGIFVKGRLYAHRRLTKEAVQTIQDLSKSNTKRCMGWSIEGNVVERDRKTGKIKKSVLRNVVLTMNPVNSVTWVELAKSFAKNHELTIDCEGLDKSLDTGGMAEVMPQSLEGVQPKEVDTDKQNQFITLLRKMVNEFRLNKSYAYVTLTKSKEAVMEDASHYATLHGFTSDEAHTFAQFIGEKHELLKSMFHIDGGEKMGLLDLLNEELEELRKSMNEDEEEEKDKDKEGEESESEDGEEQEESEDSEGEEDGEDEEEEEKNEKAEKSFGSSPLQKSLASRHQQAFEVSDFLSDLTDEIGFHLEGLQKSITLSNRKQETLMKSMASMLEVMQELTLQVEDIKAENETLRKSLDEVLSQPIGRKSVVSQREYQTISKSKNAMTTEPLTINRVKEVLEKSFEKGELDGFELARFEAGTPLQMLNLPESVKQELGI